MLADGIVDHGVSVDRITRFTDVDFERLFREFPSDALFDQIFLVLRELEHFLTNALRFCQDDLHGLIFWS